MGEQSLFKKRIFPILMMLAITLLFISITTILYTFTRDAVLLNESIVLKRAVISSAGIELPEAPAEVEKLYTGRVREVSVNAGAVKYYEIMGIDTSEPERYVVIRSGPGLWGNITVSIGYDRSIDVIQGFEIIDQNETPGLGGRITESWFKEQFHGKRTPLSTVPEGEPSEENEFDAITGATYTSDAIRDILNEGTKYAREIILK